MDKQRDPFATYSMLFLSIFSSLSTLHFCCQFYFDRATRRTVFPSYASSDSYTVLQMFMAVNRKGSCKDFYYYQTQTYQIGSMQKLLVFLIDCLSDINLLRQFRSFPLE